MAVIKGRDEYWQQVRGICILLVVFAHCRHGVPYKDTGVGNWNYEYWLILRQGINFCVATFVFLAGYFTNVESNRNFNIKAMVKRLSRLLIPYFVWVNVYTVFDFVLHGNVSVMTAIRNIFLAKSAGQLYYLLVLLQLIVLTPMIVKSIMGNRKIHRVFAFLLTPTYLIFLYAYNFITKSQFPYYHYYFMAWFIFYYLGLLAKIKGRFILGSIFSIRKSIIFVVVSLSLAVVEGKLLVYYGMSDGFAISQIKFSSFLYSFSVINLFFSMKRNNIAIKSSILKGLGDVSFGIYFIHLFFVLILDKVIYRFPFVNSVLPFVHLIQLSLALLMSYVCIVVGQKIFGQNFAKKYLGFS